MKKNLSNSRYDQIVICMTKKTLNTKLVFHSWLVMCKKDQSDMGNVCRERGGWRKNQITVA